MFNPTQRKIALIGLLLCMVSAVIMKSSVSFAATKPVTAAASHGVQSINPKVLAMALKAHQKAQSMGVAKKSILTIIDYSLPSTKPRLWVMDVAKNKVMYHTLVAHGKNTGDNIAKHFSDRPGSLQSSLGVFVTGNTYSGKHGTSLVLHGLEKGFNGNAARRSIVIHEAHYVSQSFANSRGRLGRSWGCPALGTSVAKPIMSTIKGGSVVFVYYPDKSWLSKSRFLS